MASRRIVGSARVTALPVHAAFPFPKQPEFRLTDLLSLYGPANVDGAYIETDPIADCVHPPHLFVPHSQLLANWNLVTDTFHPNTLEDPREINGTSTNIYWEVTGYSGDSFAKREYRAFGANRSFPLIGDVSADPFKYPVIRPDLWNTTSFPYGAFDHSHVNPPPVIPRFTQIARTNLQSVIEVDQYGNPTLGPKQMCQGFWATLSRGTYDIGQWWESSWKTVLGEDAWEIWKERDADFWLNPATSFNVPKGYCAIRFRVGCGTDKVWYEVKFQPEGNPEVYVTRDETFVTKDLIMGVKYASDEKRVYGQTEYINDIVFDVRSHTQSNYPICRYLGSRQTNNLEVRLIGGYLEIKIEGDTTPFVWRHMLYATDESGAYGTGCAGRYHKGDPIGLIEEIKTVFVECNWASWWVQPMKWAVTGDVTSKLINIGFVPITNPELTAHHAFWKPPVYTIDADYDLQGTNIRYHLRMTNDVGVNAVNGEYADATVAIRGVSIHIPEILDSTFGKMVELFPESVQVSQVFDPNDLCVTAHAVITFNNFSELQRLYADAPAIFWGEWANMNGLIAIAIDVMVDQYDSQNNLVDSTGWVRLMTGYANTESTVEQPGGGTSKFTMHAVGREISMMAPKFNLPWFDGMNEYWVAAYLANIGGVKRGTLADTDLLFRALVPPDPYQDSPGGGAYFLPMGTGNTPLSKAAPGSMPWQLLGKFGKQSGFMRYFNAFGKMAYEKFNPTPIQPDLIFTVQHNTGVPFDPMMAVFSSRVDRNLRDVRNQVTVIGVDSHGPLYFPTVAHRIDPTSIYESRSSIWEPSTANFLGFENAFVWMDAQFASLAYADAAGQRMFDFMRLPTIIGGYRVWLNPGVYPGKWVGVADVKAGTFDRYSHAMLPMLVMAATHYVAKGEMPITTMSDRYIPGLA